jgi:hypothetical protein
VLVAVVVARRVLVPALVTVRRVIRCSRRASGGRRCSSCGGGSGLGVQLGEQALVEQLGRAVATQAQLDERRLGHAFLNVAKHHLLMERLIVGLPSYSTCMLIACLITVQTQNAVTVKGATHELALARYHL